MKPILSRSIWHSLILISLICSVTGGLLVKCKSKTPEPLRPKASFRLASNNCTAPCDPGITNLSQFGQSYRWEFGDGGTSTDETPAHTYTKGGSYPLKLTVTGEQNLTSDTTITVTVQGLAPVAAFTVQNNNCTAACEIIFQNQSQNALSSLWDFGDGGSSTDANPKHTYAKAGTFTAKLTVTGDQAKTASTTVVVTIKSVPVPVAAFLIQNDNCIAPCSVVLQNQSINATTYSWKILTGYVAPLPGQICVTGSSCPVYRIVTEQSPSQSYSTPPPLQGLTARLPYTVELTATGPGGTQTVSKNITIREPLPVADFSFTTNSLGKVVFTNKSTNASSYLWNFGQGLTSTDSDPTTSYGSSGSYTVTLRATNGTGTSEIKKAVGVTVVK
jgi:PKD repeat protein